ncbi:MAG TPA: barstar family protein, partial [Erysipelothrix sp.]|nr:barstar family protein [Erysipelothrix sp.]
MDEIVLDGSMMINQRITHLYLRYNLKLPKAYGHNLDALYDVLSTWDKSTLIILKNKNKMLE